MSPVQFQHFMMLHPVTSAQYAGLGEGAGRMSWYNGPYYASQYWVVAHETAHNWGLLHDFVYDEALQAEVECE